MNNIMNILSCMFSVTEKTLQCYYGLLWTKADKADLIGNITLTES